MTLLSPRFDQRIKRVSLGAIADAIARRLLRGEEKRLLDAELEKMNTGVNPGLAAILKRRSTLGPGAYVFGTETGAFQPNIQTAWETLRCSHMASSQRPAEEAPTGIASSFSGSISAGTT